MVPEYALDGIPVAVGPGYENDDSNISQRDAFISVSLARFGSEWVVSAFKLGADGEPDFDGGEIFVTTFQRETLARWLYLSCVRELRSGDSE